MRLLNFDDGLLLDTTSRGSDVGALASACKAYVGPGATQIRLTAVRIGGAEWDVEIRFQNEGVHRVVMVARLPGDAANWDEWTMDQETCRKAFHEEWATRVLGAGFETLRVEVDGKWISTQWPEPAPKQATFPWGQLRSAYDGHTSQAMLVMMVGYVGG